MEKDIEILEEQLKQYKRHLENYEKDDCLTSVYYGLKKYAEALEHLIKAYKQIEEKLMYALNPINGELSIKSKENFKKIILENINKDTYTIRKELKKYWNDEINYFRKKCE